MLTKGLPQLNSGALSRAMHESGCLKAGAELVTFDATPVGIGAMADTYLLKLGWSVPNVGPNRVIAKLPSTDEVAARTAASLNAYEREVRFYRDLAPRTQVSLPTFYGALPYAGIDQGLLLEDLTHLDPGDQLTDAPLPTLRRLREELALLQAPFWNDAELAGADWLHRRLGVPISGITDRMERSWAETRERLTADFDTDERAQIDRFVAGSSGWAESLTGPFTLTHHDYRLDNVRIDPARPDHVAILDWQTVGWGTAMFDVAYLLGTSVRSELRGALEREEIARHVDDLAYHGVEWSLDEAWTAYRQSAFAVLLMLVPPTGSVKRSERTDRMFRRLLRQGARMALELEADEFLPRPH